MPERPLAISVVVPTYNRRQILLRTLETLLQQSLPYQDFEIIIVVDGSTDGTADALRSLRPQCRFRVIEQPNRGPAAARNTGFKAAQSDLILFLDDDVLCSKDLLSEHVNAHRKLGSVVVFGALFLSPDSKKNLAAECFRRELGAFHLRHLEDPNLPWRISECVFSNTSLPRPLLMDAGGFDENFRVREDLELGIRLMKSGIRLEYSSSAVAYQYYDKTAADLLQDAEHFGAADAMLARKHPDQMIEGHVKWMEGETSRKTSLREIGARWPLLEKCLLAPCCYLGQAFFWFPPLRILGVRALQARRRIRWLRGVQASGRELMNASASEGTTRIP